MGNKDKISLEKFLDYLSIKDTFYVYDVEQKSYLCDGKPQSIDSIGFLYQNVLEKEFLGVKTGPYPNTLIVDVV